MTDDPDPRVQNILQPRSKAPAILILAAIAIVCFALTYRSELYAAFIPSPGLDVAAPVTAEGHPATIEELDAVKNQMAQSSQSVVDVLNEQKDAASAQKSDLQKLADQVASLNNQVSALNDKMDALQKVQPLSQTRTQGRPEEQQTPRPTLRRPHFVAERRKPKPENPNPNPAPVPTFPTLVPQTVPPASGN